MYEELKDKDGYKHRDLLALEMKGSILRSSRTSVIFLRHLRPTNCICFVVVVGLMCFSTSSTIRSTTLLEKIHNAITQLSTCISLGDSLPGRGIINIALKTIL